MQSPSTPLSGYATSASSELPLSDARDRLRTTSEVQEEALELFDATAPGLRRYVRSCGLTPEAAEDVVQEAFLALFRHLCARGARHNLRGWLVQVSYRLALKQRERLARRQRLEAAWEPGLVDAITDPADDPETQLATQEHQRRVRAVFRALPERERQCLALRAEGVRYREIGKTLGISLGAVAKSLAYAISRLSNAVKE